MYPSSHSLCGPPLTDWPPRLWLRSTLLQLTAKRWIKKPLERKRREVCWSQVFTSSHQVLIWRWKSASPLSMFQPWVTEMFGCNQREDPGIVCCAFSCGQVLRLGTESTRSFVGWLECRGNPRTSCVLRWHCPTERTSAGNDKDMHWGEWPISDK